MTENLSWPVTLAGPRGDAFPPTSTSMEIDVIPVPDPMVDMGTDMFQHLPRLGVSTDLRSNLPHLLDPPSQALSCGGGL